MIMPGEINRPPVAPQPVAAGLTRAAIFLVVTVRPGPAAGTAVRKLCAGLSGLLRAVGFRGPDERLSCIMAFGSEVWDRLFGEPRPAELHPFREIAPARATPSRRPAISCFISAPSAWTCVSNWRRRS